MGRKWLVTSALGLTGRTALSEWLTHPEIENEITTLYAPAIEVHDDNTNANIPSTVTSTQIAELTSGINNLGSTSKTLDQRSSSPRIPDSEKLQYIKYAELFDYIPNMDGILVVSTGEPDPSQIRRIVDATRTRKPHLVILSMQNCDTDAIEGNNFTHLHQFNTVEQNIKQQNLNQNWTILRSAMYYQSLHLFSARVVKHHAWTLPLASNGCFAPVDVRDVVHAAANILLDSKSHLRRTYTICGPDLVDGNKFAELTSEALGIEIKFAPHSANEEQRWLKHLAKNDISKTETVERLMEMFELIRRGKASKKSKDLEKIVGEPGKSISKNWREMKKIYGCEE